MPLPPLDCVMEPDAADGAEPTIPPVSIHSNSSETTIDNTRKMTDTSAPTPCELQTLTDQVSRLQEKVSLLEKQLAERPKCSHRDLINDDALTRWL